MKRALILNRRCIRHPERGGAEVYTHEIAKALMGKGFVVEWFSSRPSGLPDKEEIEGISFIRKGNELTTHLHGFLHALRGKYSLIIDEFNGIGFLTFPMKNSMIMVHQLYSEFWTAELGMKGYPLKLLEKLLLSLYRNNPAITVSGSTAEDLERLGFRDITVVYNGREADSAGDSGEKEKELTMMYLGRLKKTKNPEDVIRAFLLTKETIRDAKLWIGGDGPLYEPLKNRYGAEEGVHFLGYIDNDEKQDYLKRSHFLLVPSVREGWGQVVIQANAAGTPAIGYDVPGLRDSIQKGRTGILVRDYREMSSAILALWRDKNIYESMRSEAVSWSTRFSWKKTRDDFISYLASRGAC